MANDFNNANIQNPSSANAGLGKVLASDRGTTLAVILLHAMCALAIVVGCGVGCALVAGSKHPNPEILFAGIGVLGIVGLLLMVCNVVGAGKTAITVHETGIVGIGTSKMAMQLGTMLFVLRNFQLTYDKVSSVEMNGGMYSGSITICVAGTQYLVYGKQSAAIQMTILEQQRKVASGA